ncbi:MAG: DNA recombination protein RmuC [Chloroflexi bacterium]|nr:DNA recombination protein RmuC [Chloroflexota bacterium]MXX79821.1 DNA recombination protein RmuC [Chloroflexota bacterium]MYD16692.1 DNA recombination protein RmuC [Chloroflexota bacterium]MYF23653.1 DNA recombination protein RmuC [Chloroflexota bacterium]MYJ02516.1 DNA recombination protein RmuC [Chloroflexota bacterium]
MRREDTMEIVIGLIIGLAIGGVVTWLVRREASGLRVDAATLRADLDDVRGKLQDVEQQRTEAAARLEERSSLLQRTTEELAEERQRAGELRDSLGIAREELSQSESDRQARIEELDKKQEEIDALFKSIAADVAKASNEEFRKQAAEDFKRQRELAEQELKQRVEPVGKELEQLRRYVAEMEKARAGAYEGVSKLIEETQKQVGRLNSETGDLREILRSSRHRGQWGEATLENILELGGMRKGKSFFTQTSGEHGTSIADFVLRMPGGKRIIVDSKTPFDAYREALDAPSEQEQRTLLQKHADTVLSTAAALRKTGYDQQFDDSMDFIVMWIPTDSILEGATRVMPDLIERAFSDHRVLLATPVTMIALVSGVAAALHQEDQQEKLHQNAVAIQQAGERLYSGVRRHATVYAQLGARLSRAVQAYDDGVSSIQGNLLQGARQMRELGGGDGEEAPEPDALRLTTREFRSKELVEALDPVDD